MADQPVRIERNDEQPQQQRQHESFDLTKRFHNAFTSFKLLVIASVNSLHTGMHSDMLMQFYIICEVIYLMALIKVIGSENSNMIYRYLYIVFGTLGAELLLWTSLSIAVWLVVNICLLLFALASSDQLERCSDHFQEIIQLLDNEPFSEVQFDF